MGKLARGDLMAGWQASQGQTVLGAADQEGGRDNSHYCEPFSIRVSIAYQSVRKLLLRFSDSGR